MKWISQLGGRLTPELINRYARSAQWRNGQFVNEVETSLSIAPRDAPKLLRQTFQNSTARRPKVALPVAPLDVASFTSTADATARLVWYGHSAVLLRLNGKTLLIDPMLGPSVSPIPVFGRRYSQDTLRLIDVMPPIDLLLITHDHYDHLNLESIKRLKHKVSQWFVALGVGRHLIRWGVDPASIMEFDWWESAVRDGIEVTFTPARHFSGRGVSDRNRSLWGGWALRTKQERIYFTGDSGYGAHFEAVGKALGPFDLGLIECGQYNEHWHAIHMYPEESVQAACAAIVHKAVPVHWGAFSLSLHSWKEPVERFARAAEAAGLAVATPTLGELFTIASSRASRWWDSFE